jgi:D-xylose transport system permease protein
MTEVSTAPPAQAEAGPEGRTRGSFFRSLDIDPRLFGMIVALVVIWLVFHVWSGGTFLTPRNLWNLSVQTAAVGIMATGMVLVIVTRNIDLSIGSMLAVIGMGMAILQVEWLPDLLGVGHPAIWIIALAAGIAMGALIGGFQGFIVAYIGVPAFIVTLGGLLVWRGVSWAMAQGRTIAPMDETYQRFGGGGGLAGTIGGTATWGLAVVGVIGLGFVLVNGRRRRQKYGFAMRPLWADVLIGVFGAAALLGTAAVMNSYPLPAGLAEEYAAEQGIEVPAGGIPLGLANPVVLLLVVGLVMTFVANRTWFGRYVYAIGGNPEAADLAGIKTRWTIVRVFMLMGVLTAIAAAVSTARLNAATSGLGQLAELYVIAAAVIGGTSLAGGVGTITGAMLGALVAQSLQSGMVLIGVEAPIQDIVVGVVLVFAVALDAIYRRRVT